MNAWTYEDDKKRFKSEAIDTGQSVSSSNTQLREAVDLFVSIHEHNNEPFAASCSYSGAGERLPMTGCMCLNSLL